jgi:hypothetical protein
LTSEQVEAINQARRIAKLPREQGGFWVGNTIDEDSNAFRKFEAYAGLFYRRLGYYLPVISTEGGAIAGAAEDPRYPPVRVEDLTTLTLEAYHTMLMIRRHTSSPILLAHGLQCSRTSMNAMSKRPGIKMRGQYCRWWRR